MESVPHLQNYLLAIARKHELDVYKVGAYLRLDVTGAEHYLVLENLGGCRLSVARYVVGSKGVTDPELILHLGCQTSQVPQDRPWTPIERVQRLGGWAIFAQTTANGAIVKQVDALGQRDLAEFAETVFLPSLIQQGWLVNGQLSALPKPYLTDEEQWLRGITYPYNDSKATEGNELMQKVALRLATDREVDLLAPDAQLTLVLPRQPIQLQLRQLRDDRIAVTRYVVDETGHLVADPDLVFRVHGQGAWYPEEVLYSLQAWDEYMQVMRAVDRQFDGTEDEMDLVLFTEYWAQRLVEEGWLDHGQILPPELGVLSLDDRSRGDQGTTSGQIRIVTTVMAEDNGNRVPDCHSVHHAQCYGELWTCAGCGMTFCEAERTDHHPELCVDCGLEAAGWTTNSESGAPVGLVDNCFIVLCDCSERDGSCNTWLALTIDGILTIEDQEGMWMSISLPHWLDTAMRQALQVQYQLSDNEVPF
jgi:hypothetical protein